MTDLSPSVASTPGTAVSGKIAFQGEPGAYGHEACRRARPDMEALPCATFEDVLSCLLGGDADAAVMGIENSLVGSIIPNFTLLERAALRIVGEVYLPVRLQLLTLPGATLADVRAEAGFDSEEAGKRGMGFEHLDQLALDHLYGVRG